MSALYRPLPKALLPLAPAVPVFPPGEHDGLFMFLAKLPAFLNTFYFVLASLPARQIHMSVGDIVFGPTF